MPKAQRELVSTHDAIGTFGRWRDNAPQRTLMRRKSAGSGRKQAATRGGRNHTEAIMDSYTTHLFLSMLVFAPGMVLFVVLAFVGLLMLLETTVFRGKPDVVPNAAPKTVALPVAANPAPGHIVHAMKDVAQHQTPKPHKKASHQ